MHSWYRRQLADLPVSGRRVEVWLDGAPVLLRPRRLQRVHLRRAGPGIDPAARPPKRRPASGTGGGRVRAGRAGRISAGRPAGDGGEPVDAAADDPGVAGSTGRPSQGARRRRVRVAPRAPLRHGAGRLGRRTPADRCAPRPRGRRLRRLAPAGTAVVPLVCGWVLLRVLLPHLSPVVILSL